MTSSAAARAIVSRPGGVSTYGGTQNATSAKAGGGSPSASQITTSTPAGTSPTAARASSLGRHTVGTRGGYLRAHSCGGQTGRHGSGGDDVRGGSRRGAARRGVQRGGRRGR